MKALLSLVLILAVNATGLCGNSEKTEKPTAAEDTILIRLAAYDGEPAHPLMMSFQINVSDGRKPAEFLKIGNTIRGTTLKLQKFVYKVRTNKETKEVEDASELTLINSETKKLRFWF